MSKVKKKFILYAMAAVFVLLTALLSVINVTGFTLAAQDADKLTQLLSEGNGAFGREREMPRDGWFFGNSGPMGPASPEAQASLRHFTFAFDGQGNAQRIAFEIASVTEAEAEQWVRSLLHETAGWTRVTYRYRTYERDGMTYVTVIDQGRELLSAYRILIISAVGEVVFLLICFAVLVTVSGKLLDPIAEADRKQKRFLAEVENNFKVPLTVMNAATEIVERDHGPTDITRSMRRQLKKMTGLVGDLGRLAVLDDDGGVLRAFDLSSLCLSLCEPFARRMEQERGISYQTEIRPGVSAKGDEQAIRGAITELMENQMKFSGGRAGFTLGTEGNRVILTFSNDTVLPTGKYEQAFDRFTRLENARDVDGAGLGLSRVRDVVKAHNGRAEAFVTGTEPRSFTVRICL